MFQIRSSFKLAYCWWCTVVFEISVAVSIDVECKKSVTNFCEEFNALLEDRESVFREDLAHVKLSQIHKTRICWGGFSSRQAKSDT